MRLLETVSSEHRRNEADGIKYFLFMLAVQNVRLSATAVAESMESPRLKMMFSAEYSTVVARRP